MSLTKKERKNSHEFVLLEDAQLRTHISSDDVTTYARCKNVIFPLFISTAAELRSWMTFHRCQLLFYRRLPPTVITGYRRGLQALKGERKGRCIFLQESKQIRWIFTHFAHFFCVINFVLVIFGSVVWLLTVVVVACGCASRRVRVNRSQSESSCIDTIKKSQTKEKSRKNVIVNFWRHKSPRKTRLRMSWWCETHRNEA